MNDFDFGGVRDTLEWPLSDTQVPPGGPAGGPWLRASVSSRGVLEQVPDGNTHSVPALTC